MDILESKLRRYENITKKVHKQQAIISKLESDLEESYKEIRILRKKCMLE